MHIVICAIAPPLVVGSIGGKINRSFFFLVLFLLVWPVATCAVAAAKKVSYRSAWLTGVDVTPGIAWKVAVTSLTPMRSPVRRRITAMCNTT